MGDWLGSFRQDTEVNMFYDVLTSVINIFTVQLYFIYIEPTTVAQGAKTPSERLFF